MKRILRFISLLGLSFLLFSCPMAQVTGAPPAGDASPAGSLAPSLFIDAARSQAVFIDGRSDFYGPEIGELYLRTAYGRGDWQGTLGRYRIALVLAPKDWPLADLLGASEGWRLVDQDGQAVLFECSVLFEPKGNIALRRNSYKGPNQK